MPCPYPQASDMSAGIMAGSRAPANIATAAGKPAVTVSRLTGKSGTEQLLPKLAILVTESFRGF